MDTKNFFSKIREIIREEIEYAIDKKLTQNKKTDKSTLEHGLSLYNESQATKPKSKPKQSISGFNSIKDILEETRRTLQESTDVEQEFKFTSDMAEGFGVSRGGNGFIPRGFTKEQVPDNVMKALTRDYSALVKKMDEKKGR